MPDGKPQDHGPVYIHEDEMDWETLRFPGQHSKMVFHPTPDDPTHPNAGFVRYEPGAHHPRHRHDFAQVWYVLEGEFKIGARTVGPGTVGGVPRRPALRGRSLDRDRRADVLRPISGPDHRRPADP